ncbi:MULTISPECIES: hypothetical protein [Streptomyces]|uniref:DUF2236 domain-containing protein n=1 Tax=Streptomyces dengpaensis TaxID=2049881 RepID=A0ABN5I1J1_9ACTN|nr:MULTISPECIES: hypothetical protein [Streptomyces]AVH57189.1 hypothetical protein C4B68_16915 [Streptomyces dengpaensis]PIB08910.1 hypothetical protein B1C81_11595 [Streptomyces sp. HG99]
MTSEYDWASGEGLLGIDDPAAVDAAFERGERHLGTAVIGLAFTCPLAEASPRIVRAMRLPDATQRQFAFTAAGTAARLNGELTPELYAALRAEAPGGFAEDAINDTLTFVPFRKLPPWFKWRWLLATLRNTVLGWWLRTADAAGDAWRALRGRRS